MIKIYIDENISPYIAKGLNTLDKPLGNDFEVLAIKDVFGTGAKDEEWLPIVGQENGVVVTQDLNIQRLKSQRELYRMFGVGVFFIAPPSKSGFTYWQMVEHIIKNWQDIRRKSSKVTRPFAFRSTPKKDFEAI